MGLRGMLQGKDYCTLDLVFPFVASFIDHTTGLVEQAPMTRLHIMNSDLDNSLIRYNSGEMTDYVRIEELRRHIKEFERLLNATLAENCETWLYTQSSIC